MADDEHLEPPPTGQRGVSVEAERGAAMTPDEAVAAMRINLPARRNRILREVVARANADVSLRAWWHVANVNAVRRMRINDHSWVHIQVVANIALKLVRDLVRKGAETGMVRDYGMRNEDAEVVVVLGALWHCVGMAVHRRGHEDWSLFMAADRLPDMLEGLYDEPTRTVVIAEVLQCITAHRADGEPLSLEAGIVRVADALDMAKGRSRIPFAEGRTSIHSLSAAAIETVTIRDGVERPILVEIEMNNSAGVYQIDELLRKKLRGSGLEDWIEVFAHIEGEAEKLLVPVVRLWKPVAPERHLLRAKDLMDARYAEPLDVATIARAARLSAAHFSREFRREFGETPHQYLLTRRLERAAALLRNTDRSVAEICMMVGLRSVGSFTTSFGRVYGMTPTAYRAAHPPAALRARIPTCILLANARQPSQQVWRRHAQSRGLP